MPNNIKDLRLIDITVGELMEFFDGRYANRNQLPQQEETFLKIDGCAALTGYTEEYIRQMVHKRKIPFIKLNNGGLRFIRKDIMDWMGCNKSMPIDDIAQRYIENNTIGNRGHFFNSLN